MLCRLGATVAILFIAGCTPRTGQRPLVVPPAPLAQPGFETELSRMPAPSRTYQSVPSVSQTIYDTTTAPQPESVPQVAWPKQAARPDTKHLTLIDVEPLDLWLEAFQAETQPVALALGLTVTAEEIFEFLSARNTQRD